MFTLIVFLFAESPILWEIEIVKLLLCWMFYARLCVRLVNMNKSVFSGRFSRPCIKAAGSIIVTWLEIRYSLPKNLRAIHSHICTYIHRLCTSKGHIKTLLNATTHKNKTMTKYATHFQLLFQLLSFCVTATPTLAIFCIFCVLRLRLGLGPTIHFKL